MIHASAGALSVSVGTGNWWCSLFWGTVSRPAVPLFFLCSGALLLDREIPLKRFYTHNYLRIVVALYCWAFAYQLWEMAKKGFSWGGLRFALKQTLLMQHATHLYYLHILLLVYAFLPVARVFLRSARRRECEYLLAVWGVTGILFPLLKHFPPFTQIYTMTTQWYVMNMTYAAIGYCVLGWYLRHYCREIPRRRFWGMLAAGLGIIFVGTAVLSLRSGTLQSVFLEGMSPGDLLAACGLAGLILGRDHWPEGLCRFAERLSKASFCIYLSHLMVLDVLVHFGMTAMRNAAVMIPVLTILMLLGGWVLYEVLRRIPVVQKWLI